MFLRCKIRICPATDASRTDIRPLYSVQRYSQLLPFYVEYSVQEMYQQLLMVPYFINTPSKIFPNNITYFAFTMLSQQTVDIDESWHPIEFSHKSEPRAQEIALSDSFTHQIWNSGFQRSPPNLTPARIPIHDFERISMFKDSIRSFQYCHHHLDKKNPSRLRQGWDWRLGGCFPLHILNSKPPSAVEYPLVCCSLMITQYCSEINPCNLLNTSIVQLQQPLVSASVFIWTQSLINRSHNHSCTLFCLRFANRADPRVPRLAGLQTNMQQRIQV